MCVDVFGVGVDTAVKRMGKEGHTSGNSKNIYIGTIDRAPACVGQVGTYGVQISGVTTLIRQYHE